MKVRFFVVYMLAMMIQMFHANGQDYYWVAFTDKNNSQYSLSYPEEFLSSRAIQRRNNQLIAIDSLDLPVNANYVSQVVGQGAKFIHSSKWLNGITVKAEVKDFKSKVLQLPFVKEVQLTKTGIETKSAIIKFNESGSEDNLPVDTSYYGPSVFQTAIMNGQFLHNLNMKGQGFQIAVLDGGFLNTDIYPAFYTLWSNNQILGTKDFVDPSVRFFDTHYHGMSVLSCMGGYVQGQLVGTAPKASYWLIRSEDNGSEFLIEEDNWVAAAEYADSVGADVINSSLGYFMFDDPQMDHTYAEMDGKTTRVTKGANIAASRGMLVFSSAGNEGNNNWKYIVAPADGDSVFGVGAVGKDTIPAYFTSYGPASNGDVKPNVTALGFQTYLQRSNGLLGYSNGTSFSSPVLAGMATCLWQSLPEAKAYEVKRAIEKSAHIYEKPDSLMGYGVPDFKLANQILKEIISKRDGSEKKWLVYPNPANEYVILEWEVEQVPQTIEIDVFSVDGKWLRKWIKPGSKQILLNEIQTLPAGILILRINSGNNLETVKLSKYR
ncbi:MAG: S8 family serine peptidase [Draconibacterium sp.]